jgi:hypothetical protein
VNTIVSVRQAEPKEWFWPVVMSTLVAVTMTFLFAATVMMSDVGYRVGLDYRTYMTAATSWLADGTFYRPWQLTGPYGMDPPPILYPPYTLALFVPFTWLPAALWWIAPIGLTAIGLHGSRPARWTWPLLTLGVLWPNSLWLILAGNPAMWVVAGLAFAPRWPTVAVVLKPTLAPLGLVGIRDRGWWMGLGGIGILALATAPLWPQYIVALSNFDSGRGLAYSLGDIPLVLVPLVARLTTLDERGALDLG